MTKAKAVAPATRPEMPDFVGVVAALKKDPKLIITELTPDAADLLHMAVGISGEVGEFFSAAQSQDLRNQVEELGDIEFYYEGFMQAFKEHYDVPDFPEATPRYDLYAMVIESSEILDIAKKSAIYCRDLDVDKAVAHLSNLRGIIDGCYVALNIDRKAALDANADKLWNKRYPAGEYTNEAAQERADKVYE